MHIYIIIIIVTVCFYFIKKKSMKAISLCTLKKTRDASWKKAKESIILCFRDPMLPIWHPEHQRFSGFSARTQNPVPAITNNPFKALHNPINVASICCGDKCSRLNMFYGFHFILKKHLIVATINRFYFPFCFVFFKLLNQFSLLFFF